MRTLDISKSANPWTPLVCVVYLVSFWLPVEGFDWGHSPLGFQYFLMGLIYCWCPLFPIVWPWYANVAFVIGMVYLTRNRIKGAAVCGTTGLLLGLSFLVLFPESAPKLGVGYYVWILSMSLLLVTSVGSTARDPVNQERIGFDVDLSSALLEWPATGKHRSETENPELLERCHDSETRREPTNRAAPGDTSYRPARFDIRPAGEYEYAGR
jgi:hypothetical protein